MSDDNTHPNYLGAETIATPPTCNGGARGTKTLISDAAAPAYLAALTGGGAVITPALCNGSAWVAD